MSATKTAPASRVFSGIQPTGNLHLGNYLGAIKRFVPLQDQYDCIYCVVDLHAITMPYDPATLADNTREVASAYLAAGIDPERSIVFNQSLVAEHAELAWIFNCIARMGWLSRMTQFKDKAGKDREKASVGVFSYPTLMAADILAYRADAVPVGEDQRQHLELTRDIAGKFNHDFAARIEAEGFGSEGYFPITEPLIGGPAARVMSLRDGTSKMSKSDPSDASRIVMTDTADDIARKFRKAKSDAEPLPETVEGLEGRAEADNLVGIFAALSDTTREAVLAEYGGQGFGAFKPALAELAVEKIGPVADEMRRWQAEPDEIDRVLADGAERARRIAAGTLADVKAIVGFAGARR